MGENSLKKTRINESNFAIWQLLRLRIGIYAGPTTTGETVTKKADVGHI